MARYGYKTINVKSHYRTYTVGSYPGPYKQVRKWIEEHPRKIKVLKKITQPKKVKDYVLYPKTMTKEIPQNLLDGIKAIVKDPNPSTVGKYESIYRNEYSIDIDFERTLQNPEQMLIMKGGPTSTIHVADFEIFGHSHPGEYYPHPSRQDMKNMRLLQPEFIIAGRTGKTIIMNIENYNRWKKWRESSDTEKFGSLSEREWGREKIFKKTGIRIYPMEKNVKIEMKDDPHYEKRFPRASKTTIEKWHSK